MAVESFVEKRRRELREKKAGGTESASSFVERRRKELRGEIKTPEAQRANQLLTDTLNSVMQKPKAPAQEPIQPAAQPKQGIDFMAEVAKKKASEPAPSIRLNQMEKKTLADVMPAPSAFQTKQPTIQDALKDKVPAASLLQQTGRGPANAYNMNDKTAWDRIEDFNDFTNRVQSTATFKLTDLADSLVSKFSNKEAQEALTAQKERSENVKGGLAADVIGSLIPGETTYKLGGRLVAPLVENAPKAAQRLVRGATGGALFQTGVEAGEMATGEQQSLAGRAKDIGIAAGLGGAADVILPAIGSAFGKTFLNRFRQSGIADDEIAEIAPELLALPEANPRTIRKQQAGEIRTAINKDPISTPYTFKLGEATPQTQRAASNAAEGRAATRDIDNQINELTNSYEQAVIDEYKVLKEQRDNPKGKSKGSMNFDESGNFVSKSGWVSNNPRWYQEAMKENGYQKLSNKKLYELARKHIDEGFDTEAGRAPSWRKENGYDEQLQALQQVRESIKNSVREIDPPIRVTDASIKTKKLKDTRISGESTYTEPTIRNPELTREQAIMNKVNAKQPLTQEEIEFAQSAGFKNENLFPESVPRESTYVKPKTKIVTEVKSAAKAPAKAKQAVKTEVAATSEKKIVTEVKASKPVTKKPGERGFYRTLKNSGKANEAVKRMNPNYERITNETSLAGANERVKDIKKAYSSVINEKLRTAEDAATAMRLVQEYTRMGDHETAALISSKAAEDFTTAGQMVQAASMWDRLSPEGVLLRVQNEIAKVNKALGPMEEALSLSADDAAKITKTGEKLQGAQSVRDMAKEVLDMVNSKKPGESLTEADKNLLAEFEKQVKKVNSSVKPFLKSAKSEAQKIAKIKPENRTRDQVVQYLDHKASEALARRQKARNVGIVADLNNPVIDYTIIAAAKIARGLRDFTDLTEDMVKAVGNEYREYADEVFVKATQKFRRENGLPTSTELERVIRTASKDFDDYSKKSLRRMAAEIGYYTDENLKRELTKDLQEVIKTYGKSTLGEKVASVQTSFQLLSAPTFLRNTLGNAGQFGLEKLNKVSAVPIDWAMSKFTGKRTIQFIPMNQEKAWKNLLLGSSSGWREVNAMGTLDSYNVKPSVFKDNNPLKYLTKLTGASLQGMDLAAYKAAYGDVIATYAEQMGKAQGLSRKEIKERMPELIFQLDDKVKALADQAGLYATYQDDTLLARAAQSTKQGINAITDKASRAAVKKGIIPRSLSMEGFGLGDIVLKYAKTPANLVMRGIDYSPLGFIRSVGELLPLLRNKGKSFDQHAAVRSISRAITGTVGLTALGYTLADAGLLTGAASGDPDQRSIEEQSGKGAYKANLSGIYRWVTSGFDKEAAKYRKGDKMMDYAWIQPAAISLGMGVNFQQAQNQPGKTNTELARKAILGGLRTVLENPMVTGLSDLVGGISDVVKRQDTKKLEGIVKGAPASFVPSLFGQLRTSTDNKQRETYDENLLKEMFNIIKNKVPGASKTLPISYDSLGNPRERIQNGKEGTIGQYLNSFLNPTKITTYSVSPEAKTVLNILNDSNDTGVLPRVNKRYIRVTDPETKKLKNVQLTKEQYSQLQKEIGERVKEEIRLQTDYFEDPSEDIAEKAKELKKILEDIGIEVRDKYKEELGYGEE